MQRQQQQKQQRSFRGGVGASDYAINAYGNMGHQVRGMDGGIAMKAGCTGGKHHGKRHSKRRSRRHGGKSVLMDVAVPAVLLYANNNIYKNKTAKKSSKSRRSRRYRR
jgi:hypothetical protein